MTFETSTVEARGAISSAVSWSAIIAGALAAASLTLILSALGAGLGLISVSPWSNEGIAAGTFAVSAGVWLIVIQWLSTAFGGYLTGRLRTRWLGIQTYEGMFRDTAHGFLAWALATVVVAGLLSSAVSAVVSGGASLASSAVQGTTQGAIAASKSDENSQNGNVDATGYFVDMLFRPATIEAGNEAAATNRQAGDPRAEATRILARGAFTGEIPDNDKAFLATLVAQHTGMSADKAQRRVDDVLGRVDQAKETAKKAVDEARKTAATTSLMMALSLLIGAFIGGVAGAVGGRHRDDDEFVA
jgi:hypothetical protein